MIEFTEKLKILLNNFDPFNCNKPCGNCELGKVLLEVEGEDWYSEYTMCDFLEKIKKGLQ